MSSHDTRMVSATRSPSPTSIHPDAAIGTVRLVVADLERSREFYERAIGLRARELDDGTIALSAGDGRQLIELRGDSGARGLDRRATGLYHLAILVPQRLDLAFALARLADARWPLDGASDHLVSEAIYLSDPDGHGIEIYRDRPRAEWPRTGRRLEMATLPLDLEGVLGELEGASAPQSLAPPATTIGHIHLQVADLQEAEAFYNGILGFDVVVRAYPGALFVSAGGYHHHIGLNTWHSAGAGRPAPGSLGLSNYEVLLPTEEELERVRSRVRAAGEPVEETDRGTVVRDPSGIALVLTTA